RQCDAGPRIRRDSGQRQRGEVHPAANKRQQAGAKVALRTHLFTLPMVWPIFLASASRRLASCSLIRWAASPFLASNAGRRKGLGAIFAVPNSKNLQWKADVSVLPFTRTPTAVSCRPG